jgi:hypothetical protein
MLGLVATVLTGQCSRNNFSVFNYQMKKYLIILVSATFLLPSLVFGAFNDVTLTTSTNISVGGYTLNVTGSSAVIQSIVINDANFTATLSSGSSLQVSSPTYNQMTTDVNTFTTSNNCATNSSVLTLSSSGPSGTVTVTPTATICSTAPVPTPAPISHNGGGGCINCWIQPVVPNGGFKISINGGTQTTSNRNVTLDFNAGTDIKKIAISLTGDFADASQENYSETRQWDLCSKFGGLIKNPTCPNGKYTIFAKFYTASGIASPIASSSITLGAGAGVTTSATTQYNFTRNLSLHATGADVKLLQQYLNNNGFVISQTGAGSLGNETNYFGTLTYKALVKFQKSIGWSGTGFFGPMTRDYIANH